MPGRQAHGRSLTATPKTKAKTKTKTKARSQKNALNAFGIAQEIYPTQHKKTPRFRELDAEIERKHAREEDDDEDGGGDDEDEAPSRKKVKRPQRPVNNDAEYGSDSDGNEWQLGGMAEDDEDSEIESDDAFGDSDNERFEEYSFRGSKSKKQEEDDAEDSDDSNDEEGETLGADAIDLATALDQWEEESEEEQGPDAQESDSEELDDDDDDDEDDDDESGESEGDSESDEDDDEEVDPRQLEALQGLVSDFGGAKNKGADATAMKKKIDLSDLGLAGIKDPFMKKSVKLMNKEEKEKRPGASKKLDVPLSRREQSRLDRSAAYDKTNETLDRWTETVKQNRRAEHLVFPLPQNSDTAGLDRTEIQPLTAKNSSNELESTIMSIMEQSGLSMEKRKKAKAQEYDEDGNELSRKEAQNKRRMERELNSREMKRAKRIKKIKSKAYHRVHRKQKERDEMATREAMEEAGEIDSEDEREAQDRRRALERVGQRHKDSKWAKLGSKAKRAVWDDDFRTGLTEMARKDEELRRRKEGKAGGADDSDDTSSSGSDSEGDIRRQLDALDEEDDEPQSGLMGMKFMQKAEAAKKKANDELVKQIRRDLDGDDHVPDSEEEEAEEVGRRQYGTAPGKTFEMAIDTSNREPRRSATKRGNEALETQESNGLAGNTGAWSTPAAATASLGGAWSQGEARSKKKGTVNARIEDLDLHSNAVVASRPRAKKPQAAPQPHDDDDNDNDSDDSDAVHMPLALRDQELVARAFAGEDVVGEFEREKAELAEAEDDKEIDNTLPGWGSWVGEGVSQREANRHRGRFVTKIEGIKKKDRKDAKLQHVIMNEKRIKKNDRYLASQLPHPFESRQQYERSLRLPVGPEWMTKQTFQDSTKPRLLIKQGVITPLSKPTA